MRRKNWDYKYERKTFSRHTHVILTSKYKIYRVSQDVYDHSNKFIVGLNDEQFQTILTIQKYPNPFYKAKVIKYIDELIK